MLDRLPRLARAARIGLSALALAAAVPLAACGRPATAAELQDWGTRTYAGTSKGAAFQASVTALRSLGYDVVRADGPTGQLRTAPKVVVVMVSGNQYSARAASNALAWDVDVTTGSAGVVVHATARGYSAGQAVPSSELNAGYMKRAFETLFGEIERDLGVATPAPAASHPHA